MKDEDQKVQSFKSYLFKIKTHFRQSLCPSIFSFLGLKDLSPNLPPKKGQIHFDSCASKLGYLIKW